MEGQLAYTEGIKKTVACSRILGSNGNVVESIDEQPTLP